ncbi:Clp protease N-terminal domain-containing protein [Rhodococcus aetherivorans]
MVFERFSDQARQVVVLAAGAARTHHQNSVGTDHLLLALLDDPASTGAQILTDLAPLPISEMREHLRHELAQQPTPGPAHRIPIRLSDDHYTAPTPPPAPPARTSTPGSTTASPTPSTNPNKSVGGRSTGSATRSPQRPSASRG